ncbi:hypothetical protein PCL_05791 [Purpureocillium lilacinum]|uniref:Uncharacterized protein n=1 Tax=Purpureocillium lilacinum TaxID=33203 RepID=A0A2U3EKW2_PURLI|nr:hypothetical protein Purlil1_5996 [Purpureocillium lilacinum]PWI75133.1 hypothetical protein PCL_05791 [Purpureocillium lilacinum]
MGAAATGAPSLAMTGQKTNGATGPHDSTRDLHVDVDLWQAVLLARPPRNLHCVKKRNSSRELDGAECRRLKGSRGLQPPARPSTAPHGATT